MILSFGEFGKIKKALDGRVFWRIVTIGITDCIEVKQVWPDKMVTQILE